MTQRALADKGVGSQQALSRWATVEDSDPSAAALAKLAEVLGVNGHWLLTGQGEKRAASQGADAIYAQGVRAGLARARELIEREAAATPLRPASADTTDQILAEHELDERTRPAARPKRRRRKAG